LPTFRRFPLAIKEGKGSRVWDSEGKEYIDGLAGIAVNAVGHAHPVWVQAIAEQAGKVAHVSNLHLNEPQMLLAKKLAELSGLQYSFFCNSGAEAVEGAMKIARKYAQSVGRGGTIMTMQQAFHGRTMATVAASGKKSMMVGFEPIPTGYCNIPANDMALIKEKCNQDVAAIMLELIQGEGGIKPMDHEFIKELRAFCTEQNIVLIFDEIQCGMGRTGTMFAYEQYGVVPDIMTLAKALGGGFPIGAVVASAKMGSIIKPGDHGSTFGGNPLACAAANATIGIIEEENLLAETTRKGKMMRDYLEKKLKDHPSVKEIRGVGLMIGVELNFPSRHVAEVMLHKRVLVSATADTVIRIVPPLNISDADLITIADTLVEVLGEKG
jgi:acetylornithine/N-succinyldiaminopimelate aminotransferase